ncbi:AraC family transcriptional regulator [Nocardia carnea]|uniref:AraC family transcriptional regulator n=1 Tax=Nocardia carnea TaxID=37328 RepID=UPI0024590B82|nr:AraC family transcriptional regulator [Nocardia carnea]
MCADAMPFAETQLLRTQSVREAETVGAQLLAEHRLQAAGTGFQARINGICLGGVSLYYMHYGAPLTVLGAPLRESVGVVVPVRGAMGVRQGEFAAVAEAHRSAVVIPPGLPMRLDWSADLQFYCFKIGLPSLRAFACSVDPGYAAVAIGRFEPHLIGHAGLAGLLGVASLVEFASQQRVVGTRSLSAGLLWRLSEQAMTSLLVAGQFAEPPSAAPEPAGSRRTIDRAREYLEGAASQSITPSELADAVGVSLRSLELGFRAELGTTPHAYLLETRLRRAHAELVAGSPQHGVTVTSVAKRWGFSNVGRFADKYFALYGRRPSETLRRS